MELIIKSSFRTGLIMATSIALVTLGYFGCKSIEQKHLLAKGALAGGAEIKMCQESLSKLKVIPVIGGGYLNSGRTQGFNTYLEEGECGVDSFNAQLTWNGAEMVLYTGFEPSKPMTEHHAIFNVNVVFSRNRQQKSKNTLGNSALNSKELIVNEELPLTNYPGLELRLVDIPPSNQNLQSLGTIFILGADAVKKKQIIICDFSSGRISKNPESETILQAMSKLDNKGLQRMDFSRTRAPCTVNFGTVISNRSQGVRVFFGSGDLQVATRALDAIEKYISDSINEDNK